jgi:hypothetical protein
MIVRLILVPRQATLPLETASRLGHGRHVPDESAPRQSDAHPAFAPTPRVTDDPWSRSEVASTIEGLDRASHR